MSPEIAEVVEAARALVVGAIAVPDLHIANYEDVELVLVTDDDFQRLADALKQLLETVAA